MFPFQLFRSFLPLHNPIGFGASDFIELALALLLVSIILACRSTEEELTNEIRRRADLNGDGVVTEEELRKAFRSGAFQDRK